MARRSNQGAGKRATMTSKGQVTIPKAIRDQLGLKSGVTLHFWIDPTGRIVATPLTLELEDLFGSLPRPAKPLSLEEIDKAIEEAAVERATRGL